jgi:hypothetical protein
VARGLIVPAYVALAALDDRTLCVSLGTKVGSSRVIERALRCRPEKSDPRTAPELTKILEKGDRKDILTAAVIEDCLHPGLKLIAPEDVQETFLRFDGVSLRVRADKELKVSVQIAAKSKGDAEKLEETAKGVLDRAKKGLEMALPEGEQRKALAALLGAFAVERKDAGVTAEGRLGLEAARTLLPKPGKE